MEATPGNGIRHRCIKHIEFRYIKHICLTLSIGLFNSRDLLWQSLMCQV